MTTDTPPDRLATLDQAATYLGVSRRTVSRWITSGHLTGYRLGPTYRYVRVDLDEADAVLTPRTGPETP
jgi:excisionase family DNA binding protein